ncbi:MAG TPA: CmcJ/NvfI family oxidoreductase [Steroidobacteraceae bacterium]|nr:CmcJ/NvfI family oxidoreductase [Steroidobacteraceae bacterium]
MSTALAQFAAEPDDLIVEAEIDFLAPGLDRPFAYGREAFGSEAETVRFARRTVSIEDLRRGKTLTLEGNGAALGSWPTRIRRFYDEQHVQRRYYPESAEIIKAALGADQVIVFDHNVRRGNAQPAMQGSNGGRPVHHAHTDYTPRSALRRLQRECGPQAEREVSRFVQINLWRPIRAPLRDAPLAICDGGSVRADSLCSVELRYADRTGEIFYLLHEPGQRWYFASDMGVGEAWLIKNFDSAPTGPGHLAPHSAFSDPRALHGPPRESIEVRALALFH